jgi:hypothetical protein
VPVRQPVPADEEGEGGEEGQEEGEGEEEGDASLLRPSPLCTLLDAPWTSPLADTLRAARRLALHAHQVQGQNAWAIAEAFDAMRLACCIQHGLEVLYFVHDPVVCSCGCRAWVTTTTAAAAAAAGRKTGTTTMKRELEVIRGVGWTCREVRVKSKDRDRFVRYIDRAIREQQKDAGVAAFKEVRFLVVEHD